MNQKTLQTFIAHCKSHSDERFWQALLNWASYHYPQKRIIRILFSDSGLGEIGSLKDTYNLE